MRKDTQHKPDIDNQSGFVLLGLALVMVLVGGLFISYFAYNNFVSTEARERETGERMEFISRVMGTYVHRNNRIPCPADPSPTVTATPFGAERGSGSAGLNVGSCTGSDVEGIIPFRTLGLSENEVRDAWGHFITYRVSPAFTQDPSAAMSASVLLSCRVMGQWFEGLVIGGGGGTVRFEDNGVIDIEGFKVVWIGGGGADVEIIDQPNAIRFKDNTYVRIGGDGGDVRIKDNAMGFQTTNNKRVDIGGGGDIEISGNNNIRLKDNDQLTFGPDSNLIIDNNNTVDIEDVLDDRLGDIKVEADGSMSAPGGGTVNISGNIHVNAIDFNGGLNAAAGDGSLTITNNQNVNIQSTGSNDPNTGIPGLVNVYPEKASFCCADVAGLVASAGQGPIVQDFDGNLLWDDVVPTTGFQNVNQPISPLASVPFVDAIAFVLVSHGRNGGGAYLETGAHASSSGLKASERENANGDRVFVTGMRMNVSDNDYYDDIVQWKTQSQLYSENGGSCSTPN